MSYPNFAPHVKRHAPVRLRGRLQLEALEERLVPTVDFLVGSIVASPGASQGVIDLNGTHLLSAPWDGQMGTDFLIPHSFGEVAAGSQGDIFFVGPYQGQDGVFKMDHATQSVSKVLDTQYDRIALGPQDSVIGLLIPRIEIFPMSYTIQRDGQTVLTVVPQKFNADPNAADNAINDVACAGNGDIYFTGTYQGQDGVFKIDGLSNDVSQVLTTSYERIAIAPNGDIVGAGISRGTDHDNAFIDVNGVRNLTMDNSSFNATAVAVNANQSLYFTGVYQGQSGVFRIEHYINHPLPPGAGAAVLPVVTRVSPTLYDNIAIEQDPLVHTQVDKHVGSPQLNLASADAAAWIGQFGGQMKPSQAAQIYWNSIDRWSGEVDGYYQSFLNRTGDDAGRAFWISQLASGVDESAIVQGFLSSPEYTQAHAGNAGFVAGLYQDILGRSAAAGEQGYWLGRLAAGATHAEIAGWFLQSSEAVNQVVDSLYTAYLQRKSDAGGLAYWTQQLQSTNASLGQTAQAFLASAEFRGEAANAGG